MIVNNKQYYGGRCKITEIDGDPINTEKSLERKKNGFQMQLAGIPCGLLFCH